MNDAKNTLSGSTTSTPDIGMMMDAATYFVARHYHLSIKDVFEMTPAEFEHAFIWASAYENYKAEELEKISDDVKSKSRVAGTGHTGQPFPFSDTR